MLSRLTRPLLAATAAAAALLVLPAGASAQASCPNANLIVQENYCASGATSNYRLSNSSENIGGFATKTSVDLGENVPLKIARNQPTFPANRVDITVYRMGYYGGSRRAPDLGGRGDRRDGQQRLHLQPDERHHGRARLRQLERDLHDPRLLAARRRASTSPRSGRPTRAQDNWIFFVVRDDDRAPEAAGPRRDCRRRPTRPTTPGAASPSTSTRTAARTPSPAPSRAVKVSFNRPLDDPTRERDRLLRTRLRHGPLARAAGLRRRLHRRRRQSTRTRPSCASTRCVVISGHSEYWSGEEFDGVKAARDAGVNIASFSANTAYWKVRYEDGGRTLVCYKTVQGDGSDGERPRQRQRLGPGRPAGHRRRRARRRRRSPARPTTSPRTPPRPSATTARRPATRTRRAGGRVGPDMPENQLFGVMYVGDNDSNDFPLRVPAGNADGEFAADRIWRSTGIPDQRRDVDRHATSSAGSGTRSRPGAVPLAASPPGVKRLSAPRARRATIRAGSRTRVASARTRRPPGSPARSTRSSTPRRAARWCSPAARTSGRWGLADEPDARIQQATYNILSDMGVQPVTPDGVTRRPGGLEPAADRRVHGDPGNPAHRTSRSQFDALGASTDPDGIDRQVRVGPRRQRHLRDRRGRQSQSPRRTYADRGRRATVRLRVTDNGGATDLTVRTLDGHRQPARRPPPSRPRRTRRWSSQTGDPQRLRARPTPDGTIAKYEWDLDGNGTLRDRQRRHPDDHARPTRRRAPSASACA